jgi:ADP-heptose:LPS heptosyltransferase
MLCAVPAFRAIRHFLPEAKITLIGLPWAAEFARRFHDYFDDFIEFPGFPELSEQLLQFPHFTDFLQDVRSRKFDLAIQLQGPGSLNNSLIELFGASKMAGFYDPAAYCPAGEFMAYPQEGPEVWRILHLLDFLGVPLEGDDLEFPLLPQDWEEFHSIERQYALQHDQYVVIHAGSRQADRRWTIDRFAELADALAARGLEIVLTGTQNEITLSKALAVQMNSPVINLTGKTSLGCLGVLLSASKVLVCNDTGVSHLADALKIPSVVLFTADDADRWAPLDKELHRILNHVSIVEPAMVLKEADILLREEPVHVF